MQRMQGPHKMQGQQAVWPLAPIKERLAAAMLLQRTLQPPLHLVRQALEASQAATDQGYAPSVLLVLLQADEMHVCETLTICRSHSRPSMWTPSSSAPSTVPRAHSVEPRPAPLPQAQEHSRSSSPRVSDNALLLY